MNGPYLLAIDAGTGSCRAVLFTETGAQAGAGQREWTHHEPPGVPGGQDFDVHAGWQAIAACVRDALQAAGASGADVAAVAATSMREGMVLYDAGGREIFACPNVDSRASAEAEDLIRRAAARGAVLQVGHIERFNPAVDVLRATVSRPRFIEVHRLGSFSPRSLDIDVVLDLMIHDLDIVLTLDGSEPVQVDAVGVPVLTPRVDIANVRLRFASGLIANLTASRVSAEKVRKFRVFSPRTYISVDFARREAQVHRLAAGEAGPRIEVERTAAPEEEPLRRQLAAFVECAASRSSPIVSGADGLRALRLAYLILERMAQQA